jgi:hypothetical protein
MESWATLKAMDGLQKVSKTAATSHRRTHRLKGWARYRRGGGRIATPRCPRQCGGRIKELCESKSLRPRFPLFSKLTTPVPCGPAISSVVLVPGPKPGSLLE